jgi:predicted transcriptional regulator
MARGRVFNSENAVLIASGHVSMERLAVELSISASMLSYYLAKKNKLVIVRKIIRANREAQGLRKTKVRIMEKGK